MKSLNFTMNKFGTTKSTLSRICIVLFLICFVTAGCSLMGVKKEVEESLVSTVIVGHISAPSGPKEPIIVAAYSLNNGKREIAHYTVLNGSGEYELIVGKGSYYVFAYCDKNSNLIYEEGEPAGQYGDPKLISAPAGGVVLDIDFNISENETKVDLPYGFQISSVKPQKLYSRLAGTKVDLDDELFSEENGREGYWEPVKFFKEIGGNIYFLDEYDPKKIPILFVHGATGTPGGWKYIVDNIDRTRFQPWFFYYPSGARINSMSYLLFWKLINLQIKYKFDQIYITAHSMGGLVVRSFIMDYSRYLPCVKLFISMSTPWGGDKMAELGVNQSLGVIPCWIDMQPEGEFIKSLYRTKIPENISFYMFYGHKGSQNPFRSNNDGTIVLSSILDWRPQSEAKMNYAFNEDHASILLSKAVSAQYNAIINTFDAKNNPSLRQSGGYIQVNFSYAYPHEGHAPLPVLILRPTGQNHAESVIYLNANDNGRIFGPFPSGEYTASMITTAAKPEKKWIPVTIESRKTNGLDFVFKPDGMVFGYITSALTPEDRPVGMPAGRYLPEDKKVAIQSITLNGNGIHRSLHPINGDDLNYYDNFISRTDFCHSGYFNFFDLSAGEYEVVIEAQGYKSIVEKTFVVPGKQSNFIITELSPEKL